MINGTTLILKWLIFHFLIEMFLVSFPMVYTFRNLLVLQECVLMLMTSTIEINFLTSKLLNQGYRYHKLCKAFLNFVTDTQS